MVAFLACMGIAMISAIESIDPIVYIVRCMRVHDVDYHEKPKTVSFVHQILEIIG